MQESAVYSNGGHHERRLPVDRYSKVPAELDVRFRLDKEIGVIYEIRTYNLKTRQL